MDSTLSALTASTPGTAGLLYAVQGGADRKLSMTAAGATLLEAANAAAQLTALGAATLGANTFTGAQTITQGAPNAGVLTSSGYNVTGSGAGSMIDLSGTHTSAASGASLINVSLINTSSATSATFANNSKFFQFRGGAAGATNLLSMSCDGKINIGAANNMTIRGSYSWHAFEWLNGNTAVGELASTGLRLASTASLIFGGPVISTELTFLSSTVAATLQLGMTHATTATAQTFKAHDVTTGTGASLTLAGGKGSAAGGALILATSATNGAPVAAVTVNNNGVTTFAKPPVVTGYTVAGLPATAANGAVQGAHAFVTDATAPTYLGALTGGGAVVCPVFYDGSAWVSH